jgi:hypothetical protein
MDFHAMMCFVRLAEMAPDPVAEKILSRLRRGVHLVAGDGPDDRQDYGPRPLWFAPDPDSPLSDELHESIQFQLEYEIESQGDDGGWRPGLSWGQFESDWVTA